MNTTKPMDELREIAISACIDHVNRAYFAPDTDSDWDGVISELLRVGPIAELIAADVEYDNAVKEFGFASCESLVARRRRAVAIAAIQGGDA